ncbi:MAG TPA: diacylglycerol kinase family protein, partial [Gemmatimonadales bacterium]
MVRALLITNPAAARTQPRAVDGVMRTLRAAGWEAEVLATGGPGDARRLAESAVAEGMDVVAVFGGDGTTMQAAAALVGTEVSLGVIPGGTGNLLAGNLRIPASPERAARTLVAGRPRPFDLGRMQRPDGLHYFA